MKMNKDPRDKNNSADDEAIDIIEGHLIDI